MGPIEIGLILIAVLGVVLLGAATGAYLGLHGPAEEISKTLCESLENAGISGSQIHVTVPIPDQLIGVFSRIEMILWGMAILGTIIALAGLLDLVKFWAFFRRRKRRG
ncbi:MAG: hypothetical protein QXE50_08120 [Nitrososphaerota archaeon]